MDAGDDAASVKRRTPIDDTEDLDRRGRVRKAHIDEMSASRPKRQPIRRQTVDPGPVEDPASGDGREADAWNRPLSGSSEPYSAPGTGWGKKFHAGPGDVRTGCEGEGPAARDVASAIGKSTYGRGTRPVRGCDCNAMGSFSGTSASKSSGMGTDGLKPSVGMSDRIRSSVPTGTAAGEGFSYRPVAMEIYRPAGSETMYAGPSSAFPGASHGERDGGRERHGFGRESETISRRGGHRTATDVYEGGDGEIHVVSGSHPERGHGKFRQDPEERTGPKGKYE